MTWSELAPLERVKGTQPIVVSGTIETRRGTRVTGRNDCRNFVATCPRAPGEDYSKCTSICGQVGHAEIVAVEKARAAGLDLQGAVAFLRGIDFICQHCRTVTEAAGITRIYVGRDPALAHQPGKALP